MRSENQKQLSIWVPAEFHKAIKLLACHRGTTITDLLMPTIRELVQEASDKLISGPTDLAA